jgi:hypothetical protein
MFARHLDDLAFARDVIAERHRHAADERRARLARQRKRQGAPLRPVGRLLVRLGIALGGGPEAPVPTLSTVRPR